MYQSAPGALAEHARFLAKRGVNMVRLHAQVLPRGEADPIDAIDEETRDRIWRAVAAFKREGIYTTLSFYFAHTAKRSGFLQRINPAWGIPRDPAAGDMGSLLFFDPVVQEAHLSWLRRLMLPVNPHTGVALKDEPALGVLQVQNEDSLLFWTLDRLGGEDRELLRRRFGAFLAERYGSLGAAREAWGGSEPDGVQRASDWDAGSIEVGPVASWLRNRGVEALESPAGRRRRDGLAFVSGLMRGWNQRVAAVLREEIGAPHLLNAGNWRTANAAALGDLERWTYTPDPASASGGPDATDASALDVVAVNRYTPIPHAGEHANWAVRAGQVFQNRSATRNPQVLPLWVKQNRGRGFLVTEGNWNPPNLYRAEGPLLVAAYQTLLGVDGFFWFQTTTPQWAQPTDKANGFLPSLKVWEAGGPDLLGQFPANALIARLGLVSAAAEPAVLERRPLVDLYAGTEPALAEEPAFDPNRDAGGPDTGGLGDAGDAGVDPLAFLVGPVVVEVDEAPDASGGVVDRSGPFIDRAAGTVTSSTGELTWDFGRGLVRVDAPAAQGFAGFVPAESGRVELADATFELRNPYAAAVAVAVDAQPLSRSRRVLIQVGTTTRSTGWEVTPATDADLAALPKGRQAVAPGGGSDRLSPPLMIASHGGAPWRIERVRGRFSLRNPGLTEAVVLDENGHARGVRPLERTADGVTLTLPEDAVHVLLR